MPRFLNTSGKATLGIGICDRCKMKFPLDELFSDPNSPGLKVCRKDVDDFDPWRKSARQAEPVNLRFVRPDESVSL